MKPDMTNGKALGELLGPYWVRRQFKCLNFIVISNIRYYLRTSKMVLFYLEYSKAQPMHPSLRILLSGFYSVVGSDQSRSLLVCLHSAKLAVLRRKSGPGI